MDEGVHVGGVEVVLLVPGRGGQDDVRVNAGRGHAKVERDQQIELSFRRLVVPGDFLGLVTSLHTQGLVGASFAVGTPYVARFFPRNRGFALGVFGAGTSGAAINMFVAPVLVSHYGWHSVPRVYAVLLLVTAVVFRFLALPDPAVGGPSITLRKQIAALRDPRVWKYCQYYSVVFGGFTALSVWMPQYFVNQYRFPIAQAALMAACFSLPGGVLRAAGGWLSDKFGAHAVT